MARDECKHEISPASACTTCRRANNPLKALVPRSAAQRRTDGAAGSFEARYAGRCADCDGRIAVGDRVTYEEDQLVHDRCPDHG